MIDILPLTALLIGVAGGIHCVGMCGGVVAALTVAIPKSATPTAYHLAYNTGRIVSYTAAGAITGYAGQMMSGISSVTPPLLTLLSGCMLFAMACYIGNWWRGLVYLERAGGKVWRVISPLSKRFVPFKTPMHAVPYGMIWGWLPCGLVYSTLTYSLASGNALHGALIMLCFGLGTLPTLLLLGKFTRAYRGLLRHPALKLSMTLALLLYSLYLIFKGGGALM